MCELLLILKINNYKLFAVININYKRNFELVIIYSIGKICASYCGYTNDANKNF